jgi:DNA-binding GntR family transcriptional regulator
MKSSPVSKKRGTSESHGVHNEPDVPPATFPEGTSMVETAYERLLVMINGFEIKPGERVNEVAVAKKLGISRTPLREALNRLAIEGFLTIRAARGFFCRDLDPDETMHLYELRAVIEAAAVRLAAERAEAHELASLAQFLKSSSSSDDFSVDEQVAYDEGFHEEIVRLSGNGEILKLMKSLNQRIRPLRWIYLGRGRQATQAEHRQILAALMAKEADKAAALMETHIMRRREEIEEAIRHIYGEIYVGRGNSNKGV